MTTIPTDQEAHVLNALIGGIRPADLPEPILDALARKGLIDDLDNPTTAGRRALNFLARASYA